VIAGARSETRNATRSATSAGSAGVTAPTLYHHFGSKQALIDAVINYGVPQYQSHGNDPVASIREGWDAHVRYGLENPSFYVLLHGRIRVGVPCAAVPRRPDRTPRSPCARR
jgi:AcrR family transcriptional regulator